MGAWTALMVAKSIQKESENDSRQLGAYLNRQSDSPKERLNILLIQTGLKIHLNLPLSKPERKPRKLTRPRCLA
jgi:hypothetical protein